MPQPLRSSAPAARLPAFVLAAALALLTATFSTLSPVPLLAAPGKGPDTVADVAERVMDAVVNISTSQNVAASRSVPQPQLPPGSPFEDFFDEFFKRRQDDGGEQRSRRVSSLGSGFVIDPSGLIVTNNHVIADADEIFANFNDGSKLKAELIGRDTKTDLALLRVKPDKPLVSVKFGDSEKLRVGDWVMAIGNPFGLGGTLTVGVVSARNRDINSGPYDNFIQTDAAINRGNSGGPLFNMEGEVIGINTAIISPSGGSIGIGFAVPAATAKPVLAQLEQFKEVRRGWIGVRIQPVTDDIAESLGLGKPRGALIGVVSENSPAAKGGIKAGDVIVKFNGRDIKEVRDLTRTVADTMADTEVDVVVVRKGKEETLRLKVARMPEDDKPETAKPAAESQKVAPRKALGIELSAMSDELRKRYSIKSEINGVVITGVDASTPAANKGIKAGQVIVQVGQEAVVSPADVEKQVDALRKQGKRSALLLVSDGEGKQEFVTIPLN
ncbi:UNVERIFIED_ORG: serine protease Do [Xanthobacter viscosus]|uniref:Probable periplasmic serine endoprotease DegP-like n=1 Tax=Xanthobacter autotrophicus TaxID=280 RepID=A0A6C1KL84_XANAU|nr:DegQ family serine endoprotease [Xanthobacter autotrophicus]TLX44551.1 DegQ family serine endoprotease [Xanthobacter autotrophicus]